MWGSATRGRFIASLVVLGIVVAGCSDDDEGEDAATTAVTADSAEPDGEVTEPTEPDSESTEPAEATGTTESEDDVPAEADRDGVLRMTYDLVAASRGGFHWDPSEAGASTGDLGLQHWVYGGLMRRLPDGELVPDLAENVTVVDENTIEISLREGLALSDGTPLDGDMVKASLERNLEKDGSPAFASEFFKLSEIEVTDPTTVVLTIPDGTAAGWADIYIAGSETVIVPPGTDFSMPEGFGPYTVAEFVPEERMVLERNPNYWDAESINVARIELVNAVEGQAAVAALNAGQADWVRLPEVATMDAVDDRFELVSTPDPTWVANIVVCKSTEPFDDPRVRQALSMAIDREAINEALYNGEGIPAWDLWPEDHPFHNPELTGYYAYDPEGARELLAEAGYPEGFEFDGLPIPVGGMPELAQVVQQQFADIGVTMNISQSANFVEDLYLNNTVPVGFVPTFGEGGLGKFRQWVGESIGNICGYDDRELAELANQLWTVSGDSDEAAELWHEAQEKVVEDALSILVVFSPVTTAYDPDQLGDVATAWYPGVTVPDIYNLYVKA